MIYAPAHPFAPLPFRPMSNIAAGFCADRSVSNRSDELQEAGWFTFMQLVTCLLCCAALARGVLVISTPNLLREEKGNLERIRWLA